MPQPRRHRFSLVVLAGSALALAAVAAGWDLTRPLSEGLPDPIAVIPGPDERAAPLSRAKTWEDEVTELVNQERWNNGQLAPLSRCALLDTSSETHSSNMATRNFFAHCDLDTGTMPWDRMTAAGYNWSYAAENIAAGYASPSAVMAGWMASSGHRANILSTSVREIGVGYVYDSADSGNVRQDPDGDCLAESPTIGPYYHYWTQNFGQRSTVYPVVINREAYETATVDVELYLYGTGWAVDMRIRNESGSWSAWQPFAADVAWQLSSGPGLKEVFVEIRNGATVRSASDTINSTAVADDAIFSDGFETGTTSAWSFALP